VDRQAIVVTLSALIEFTTISFRLQTNYKRELDKRANPEKLSSQPANRLQARPMRFAAIRSVYWWLSIERSG
jgi:hypothetical protein